MFIYQLTLNLPFIPIALYTNEIMIATYVTPDDLSSLNGYRAEDMQMYGYEMDMSQYQQFLEYACNAVTEIANRWCNVTTYFIHEVEEEYHTLDTSDFYTNNYGVRAPYMFQADPVSKKSANRQRTIYPRGYPVQSVEKVWINTRRDDQIPEWRELFTSNITPSNQPVPPLPPEEGKVDYKFIKDGFDSAYILFVKWLPMYGVNNVCISYTCGYPDGDPVFEHLKLACMLMAQNILAYKKKQQEAATIRASGVMDYAQMFALRDENAILTPAVRDILNLVRRSPLDPCLYA